MSQIITSNLHTKKKINLYTGKLLSKISTEKQLCTQTL